MVCGVTADGDINGGDYFFSLVGRFPIEWVAAKLGYPNHFAYLGGFKSSKSRADMADRFVRLANEYDLDVKVVYE